MSSNDSSSAGGEASADYIISQRKNKEDRDSDRETLQSSRDTIEDTTSTTQKRPQHQQKVQNQTEDRVPVMEQRLNVDKRASTEEATITKEPITETKTIEVPLTHEEMTIERRPASGDAGGMNTATESPVDSKKEIKVPLKKEDVEVTKQPYVKEEVAVKKKPITETRQVSEDVTSEE